jgi:hypothetical protein
MSFTPTSPVTGGPQTGFTSPTYTLTVDTPPAINAKQYAVTAIGGTQAGVDAHSVSRPFTITQFKPSAPKVLGKPNPTTGVISDVPNNVYTTLTRKGVTPLAGQNSRIAQAKTELVVPAGSDVADPSNLRAMLSAHFGAIWQQSGGIGDLVISGILG